ncbi:hypothetical protein Bpfe_012022 [Biomphalaria pfeifferi]|uniref:Uncharacterized protein n=1 Tax=Biomphalaria pfeifferi TaxID=112525 RepID=A0AAD8BR84_BIOPF|nr:hypothetical protein Bpfe_012022 [Biomphalaria pfeifferi]
MGTELEVGRILVSYWVLYCSLVTKIVLRRSGFEVASGKCSFLSEQNIFTDNELSKDNGRFPSSRRKAQNDGRKGNNL